MNNKKILLDSSCCTNSINAETLQIVRRNLQKFIANIKIEPTDIQHDMLKNYITSIIKDIATDHFKLNYKIEFDNEILLKKTLYFDAY